MGNQSGVTFEMDAPDRPQKKKQWNFEDRTPLLAVTKRMAIATLFLQVACTDTNFLGLRGDCSARVLDVLHHIHPNGGLLAFATRVRHFWMRQSAWRLQRLS